MIRKILFTALLFVTSVISSVADEQKKVMLNNDDHTSEIIRLSFCNIFVTFNKYVEGEDLSVDIELENLYESNSIILFDQSFNEKTLKRLTPSIRYDKIFGGSKGKRYIDECSDINRTMRIRPSQKSLLFTVSNTDSGIVTCRLPLYIAKPKGRSGNKLILLEKNVIELEIELSLKPDEEYINLLNEYDLLHKEISQKTFCTNKRHRGENGMKLMEVYEDNINDLRDRINAVVISRSYMSTDKGYRKFMDIIHELDNINLEDSLVSSCGNDRPAPVPPSCRYRNLSYATIYKRFENYYIDIHNGVRSKIQVIDDVKAIYNCVRSHNHGRKEGERYKSRITEYYNKINSH